MEDRPFVDGAGAMSRELCGARCRDRWTEERHDLPAPRLVGDWRSGGGTPALASARVKEGPKCADAGGRSFGGSDPRFLFFFGGCWIYCFSSCQLHTGYCLNFLGFRF